MKVQNPINIDLQKYKSAFKALSDDNRLFILQILTENGRTCVCDLSELLNLSQSRLSYHLKILLDVGFILCRTYRIKKNVVGRPLLQTLSWQ